MFVGIDQSKRSTAAVCIDSKGQLVDFIVVSPPMEVDGVELIKFQWSRLYDFLERRYEKVSGVALEGLSFNAVGSSKDLLAGIFWYIRTRIIVEFALPVGVIPVTAWRSKVISAAERKVAAAFKGKDAIKKFTVTKLPFEVRVKFEQFVQENKLKPAAIFDLSDAYFIAQYRLSLEEK